MLTFAQVFSDALNKIDDKYVVEAIEYQHHKTKHIPLKWIVIAAALLVGLSLTTMAAIHLFGLRDLILHPEQTYTPDSGISQTAPEQTTLPAPDPVQTNTAISLSGYMNTPESQALSEWQAFLDQYDKDQTILSSIGNRIDKSLRQYLGYGVYTQEMMDELERIADKYGLKLHTENYDLFAHPELIAPCEGYLGQNRGSATYMYEDGSFHVDGAAYLPDFGIVDFQFKRSVRGSLHASYLMVRNISEYQEWEYTTTCGVPVVLALGPGRALVLADLKDSFVTVLGLAGTNEGMTQAALEQLADSFDFSKLDPVVVPELADIPDDTQPVGTPASEYTTARETYAAVLRELLYCDIFPDGTPANPLEWVDLSQNRFAVLDVTGDGQEDLILLYTTTYTAGMRGMVVSFDGTYTGIARPLSVLLDEYHLLTFYDNGYITAGASHNQTLSEFWPYTLYEMVDYRFCAAVSVSALDKNIMEAVGKGAEYPDEIDVSKTGRVYQLEYTYSLPGMQPGTHRLDAAEYEAWLENAFYGVQELEISYQALTEENIRAMETE